MKKSINKKALAMLLSAALALSPCAGVYAQDLQGMYDPNEILDVQEIPEEQEIPKEQKIPEEQVEQLPGELDSEVTVPESVSEGNVEALEEAGPNEAAAAAAESAFDIQDGVLVKYTGSDREVVIPEGVTKIGAHAFSYNYQVEKVVIPEGVVDISDFTFYNCDNLKNVELPKSLKNIGNSAFYYCAFKNIEFPESLESIGNSAFDSCWSLERVLLLGKVVSIGDSAFYNCSHLKTVEFSESLESIGDHAFRYCSELKSIVIPKKVNHIGTGAFSGCETIVIDPENPVYDSRDNCNAVIERESGKLVQGCIGTVIPDGVASIGNYAFSNVRIENIKIPEGVESIDDSAFYGCWRLENVELPESLNSIGNEAFLECDELTSVTIPKGVKHIGRGAFSGCETIVVVPENPVYDSRDNCNAVIEKQSNKLVQGCKGTLVIPDTVTVIGSGAFYESRVNSIEIPQSVATIEDGAFQSCYSLGYVYIPDSVTSIGENVFDGCKRLTGIYGVKGSVAEKYALEHKLPFYGDFTWPGGTWSLSDGTLTINGTGTISRGKGRPWKYLKFNKLVIGDGITAIGTNAFSSNILLEEVNLPKGLKSIGNKAFSGCKELTQIEIPESVETIGYKAFYNNILLEKITLSDGLKTIDDYAFSKCRSLAEITIPGSVESIGRSSFSINTSLNKVILSSGLREIGQTAFSRCGSLTEITIPGTVQKIGRYAFSNCKSLHRAIIEEGVTKLPKYMFQYDRSLTEVNLPTTLTSIGAKSFQRTAIKSIPNNVTRIAYAAFASCTALENIDLRNVESVGSHAFANCTGLKSVTVGNKLTKISGAMFRNDQGLESIELPETIQSIGPRAFQNTSLKSIQLPSNVTAVAYGTFKSCTALETADLSKAKNITSVGAEAFKGTAIKKVELPSKVTDIAYRAFGYCTALEQVTLNEGLASIGQGAFSNCEKLTPLKVPNSLSVNRMEKRAYGFQRTLSVDNITPHWAVYENAEIQCNKYSEGHRYSIESGIKAALLNDDQKGMPEIEDVITVEGCTLVRDGKEHQITVTAPAGVKVTYSLDGKEYGDTNPAFSEYGEYPVYFKAAKEGYRDKFGVGYVVIEYPAIEGVSAEGYDGILDEDYGHRITVTAPEGAKVRYSTDGRHYSWRNPSFWEAGEFTVYYKVKLEGCKDFLGSALLKIRLPGSPIEGITSKGYDGLYDGKEHSIEVTVPEGAMVTYSQDAGEQKNYTSVNPSFKEVGEYTVYYKVTKEGYEDAFGSAKVIIRQLPQIEGISVNGYEGYYDGKEHSIDVKVPEGAEVTYSQDAGEPKNYTATNPSFKEAGEYTVYYKVTKAGFQDAFGSAKVIIRQLPQMEGISANGYEGYYDGKEHRIEVTAPEGAEVTYSQDKTEPRTYTSANPSFKEAGEYTVYYKVAKEGYQDAYGSAEIRILALSKMEGVSASGYEGTYDKKAHSITVKAPEGAEVFYSRDTGEEKNYSAENPRFTEVGEYTVYYKVTKTGYEDALGSAKVVIKKASSGGTAAKPKKKGTKLKDTSSKNQYVVKKSGSVKKGKVSGAEVEYKGTSAKKSSVQIPASVTIGGITYKVTAVASNAFKNNKKLTTVKMGSNITSIGSGAFSGCKKLKNVVIGKKTASIGSNAFSKCTSLSKIAIPSSVKTIGKQAFSGCKKLKTITIKTTKLTAKNVGNKAFSGIHKKALVKVPKKKLKAYQKLFKKKGLPKSARVKK